ncbi:MAG: signal recognition particle protein [Deltaproteobacteria bacterium]|nr:signal recognition particle protein [Deltaproteobacteria bacterium]
MFEALSEKLAITFKKLRGHGKLSEANIQDALKDVRMSLLEADVNYKVVKTFIDSVKTRAMGTAVLDSLTPAQQFIKIVNEELAAMMGGDSKGLNLSGRPPLAMMMVGLQGSGKTTSLGKLARWLVLNNRKPFLVPADVYRPAAIDQLKTLAGQLELPCFDSSTGDNPVDISRRALAEALVQGHDVVLIDTAGRLQVDEPLMAELRNIKAAVNPAEILLVADAMTGQDAVNVARKFDEDLNLTGVVLTKMDGDARGGAALSIRAATGKPIKFVGIGEKLDALEIFHPDRVASRILGMGDMLSLIEKAQTAYDEKKAVDLQKKIKKNEFSLEDMLESMQQMGKMGPVGEIADMIPGMGAMMKGMQAMKGARLPDDEVKKIKAIIQSMTPRERRNHAIIDGSRRRRIAGGSGTTVQDVNQVLKQYMEMRKMIKRINKGGIQSILKQFQGRF